MSDMADLPSSSSQDSHYERNRIPTAQGNLASSPPKMESEYGRLLSNQKIKKPPTVTPKRFTKFFTPRNTLSARGGRQSKAGRQLMDITKNGVNRRRSGMGLGDYVVSEAGDDLLASRPFKRRKFSIDLASSPPQSSPLKHVQTADQIHVFEDEPPLSPTFSEADTLPDLLEQLRPFPQQIRRLRQSGPSRRILERSFGGYDALSRGFRGTDHGADVRAETANFVTTPKDLHTFRGAALPFCTTTCNTNSLVAVGDEEGSVRLIDSSASSEFNKPHVKFRVHHNAVMDIAFCSDDYVLATSSGDQTARVVDMQTQQTMVILTGHTSSVKQVRFRPGNDNMITTSARDGSVQIWDLRCGGRSSIQNFRASVANRSPQYDKVEPEKRFSAGVLQVGYGHENSSRPFDFENRDELSITSFQHLPHGREHLIITASEVDASIKLWDLRNAGRRSPVPLSSTPPPQGHFQTRHYGINAMALSGDGSRLYSICRDATVYAYSTNQLVLGYAPEMSWAPSRRRMLKEPMQGLAPLYAFKHPKLRVGTFYIKASLRPAKDDHGEMLAVGSTDKCPILFPTDERYFRNALKEKDADNVLDNADLLSMPPSASQKPASESTSPNLPISQHGTALLRAHNKEVTSLAWTTDGNLISVSDDFSARCWREDVQQAREYRTMGEVGGGRWRSGWAEVDADWDEEEC